MRPTADATRMQYLIQVVERLVAARPEIHLDAFDERLERRARQAERGHERGERASLPRLGRAALETGGQLATPARDLVGGRRSSAGSRSLATSTSSTASSTARQKSHTAMIACRLAGGSTRNE